MDPVERFRAAVKNEMVMTLATCAQGSVTMRLVSPAVYGDAVLLFTDPGSKKYAQLKENPHCCISIGSFFAEAEAEFVGPTMGGQQTPLRAAYETKFPGAFAEGVTFGGRNAEFLLLHPTRLSGWAFADDVPTADGVPNVPFEIELK